VLVLDRFTLSALLDIAFGLIAVYAATALFHRLQPGLSSFPVDAGRWTRQALVVSATSVVALGLHPGAAPDIASFSAADLLNLLEP
jgi:hypothetical protein